MKCISERYFFGVAKVGFLAIVSIFDCMQYVRRKAKTIAVGGALDNGRYIVLMNTFTVEIALSSRCYQTTGGIFDSERLKLDQLLTDDRRPNTCYAPSKYLPSHFTLGENFAILFSIVRQSRTILWFVIDLIENSSARHTQTGCFSVAFVEVWENFRAFIECTQASHMRNMQH